MKKLLLFIVVILVYHSVLARTEITQKNINYVREGPGAYYKLVEILPAGIKVTILEEKGNWFKIHSGEDIKGWMPKNSFVKGASKTEYKEKLTGKTSVQKVSKSAIILAIKGLRKKISMPGNVPHDFVPPALNPQISINEVNRFLAELKSVPSSNTGKVDMDDVGSDISNYDPDISEYLLGSALSAEYFALPPVKNKNLVQYSNLIAAALTVSSGFYDWNFTVTVLDDDKINGYAFPGGYIFLTKGAVDACSDESELAFIIAHEAAHILFNHGFKEMSEQKVQLYSDKFFSELAEETGDTSDDTELENIARESYNRIVNNRLLNYEIEADLAAAVLIANAGYDPFAGVRVTEKLARLTKLTTDMSDENYLSGKDAMTRYNKILQFCNKNFNKTSPGSNMKTRFLLNK